MLFFLATSPCLALVALLPWLRKVGYLRASMLWGAAIVLGLGSQTVDSLFSIDYFLNWQLLAIFRYYLLSPDLIYGALVVLIGACLWRKQADCYLLLVLLLGGLFQGRAIWDALTINQINLTFGTLIVPLQRLIFITFSLVISYIYPRFAALKILLVLPLLALILTIAHYNGRWLLAYLPLIALQFALLVHLYAYKGKVLCFRSLN